MTRSFGSDRHGTEMAGVIAAVANNREGIVGIAPNARLLVFKACWQAHSDADAARCNSFTLARALTAAFDAHAQVINLSLAGPDDPLLGDLIREGLHRGVLFVGAAPDAAGVETGLLHRAGVIEVASCRDAFSNRFGVIRAGPRNSHLASRRTLRLRFRCVHCNGTGQRSSRAHAGQESRFVGGLCLPTIARHEFFASEPRTAASRALTRAPPW